MKVIQKNKLLVLIFTFVILFCGVMGVGIFGKDKSSNAKADEIMGTPTITIESNNVSYADSIYILYAVSHDGFDRTSHEIKMLFWEELQEEYVIGSESYFATSKATATVNGKDCLIFYSRGIAAKEMTKDVYARLYVEINGEVYYSEVSKFSVLEYVYTMRENGDLTETRQNLFDSMLDYGAAAQEIFSWTTDRLANDTYYEIKVINGKASDGFRCGRYKQGDKITIKADDAPSGEEFYCWKDKDGNIVGESEEIEIEVGSEKNEYTAVYQAIVMDEQGLTYTLNADGDGYTVTGCNTVATEVVIPSTYNNLPVTAIGDNAFLNCDNLAIYCEVETSCEGWQVLYDLPTCTVYWYSESEPALNADITAYDGNFWRYVDGEIGVWIYTPQEEVYEPTIPENTVIVVDKIWRADGHALSAETTEKEPDGFHTVTEFDWKNNPQGWITTATAVNTGIFNNTTDLSDYSDIYFAIKAVNGTMKTVGLEEEAWYNGGDWLYVHYQQTEDGLWSLVSLISLDGYLKTDVQIGIDAGALADFPTLRGLLCETTTSGLYPIRESADTETVIYMTDVLGVKK